MSRLLNTIAEWIGAEAIVLFPILLLLLLLATHRNNHNRRKRKEVNK